ncbi:MAG: protein BatD [candidate division Zixibacteria bacterium]|nr:protein BatD [candidate division Zixibacteria bacterium]
MRLLSYIVSTVVVFIFSANIVLGQATNPADTVKSVPGITIETEIDKAEIYIGDLINYRLTVFFDSNIILTPPPIGANLGSFDVKDYQADDEINLDDGRRKIESRFLLTTFTTGDYIIPPIPIEYMKADSTRKILISEPIAIRVSSLLSEDSDTLDIRDLKPPFDFEPSKAWLYYLLGGIVLVVVLSYYLIWRYRRKKQLEAEWVDPRKPWEIAFEEMAILKENNYPAENQFKLYYIELSEIIRAFLGRIYTVPVLDMTTDEFCDILSELEIAEDQYKWIKGFLKHSDLVKFAKLIPELAKTETDFDESHQLIDFIMHSELRKIAAQIETSSLKKVEEETNV